MYNRNITMPQQGVVLKSLFKGLERRGKDLINEQPRWIKDMREFGKAQNRQPIMGYGNEKMIGERGFKNSTAYS